MIADLCTVLRSGTAAFAAATVLATAMPSTALAAAAAPEGSESDEERALELFNNGRALFDEGNYPAAITAFEAAYEISKEANLLYNISLAYDRMNDYDQAIYYLDQYRALAPANEHASLDERRESLVKRRKRAAEDAELEAARKSQEENDNTGDSGGSGQTDTGPTQRIFTVGPAILTAVAVAGLGAGIGLGVASQNASDSARDNCTDAPNGENLCQGGFEDDAQSSRNLATGANVAFGVGGAAAVGAIVWIAINASKRAKQNKAAVAPSFNGRHAGLVISGRF
jgi:tetratricopeptide (TPR) repeat protein